MNDEGESGNELTYCFTIRPPWWKTILAKLLFVVFIISALLAIYYWRVNALRKQKKQLELVVMEKTAEIINQNEELIALNAEQRTLNEELTALNEELYNQREELEITLETLKKAQDQLIQSEKMASLGILAAGITHEINNPLNFIACGTFIIEQFFEDNYPNRMDELRPMLESIKLGIKRSTDIVTSLNQFSRQGGSNNEICNLHTIIENCLTILQNELKMRVEVIKHFSSEPMGLVGNEGKLHQVFINILSNASQAIEGKGTIEITTENEEEYLKITITDTGHGISKENLSKINDPFFTTKEAGKGVGLGLSIVYSIIAEHKGSIEYESEVGLGTKVIIRLPVGNRQKNNGTGKLNIKKKGRLMFLPFLFFLNSVTNGLIA
jgi:C4-dicarboxylate-specific signal transduction histidine kinase